mmetsp:Transcript_16368/g.44401  ORF Transcript_16368/g.44401 Transcript_16368/m.44401 type:complete len:216 (+) Transcript_16368:660-1307(+)
MRSSCTLVISASSLFLRLPFFEVTDKALLKTFWAFFASDFRPLKPKRQLSRLNTPRVAASTVVSSFDWCESPSSKTSVRAQSGANLGTTRLSTKESTSFSSARLSAFWWAWKIARLLALASPPHPSFDMPLLPPLPTMSTALFAPHEVGAVNRARPRFDAAAEAAQSPQTAAARATTTNMPGDPEADPSLSMQRSATREASVCLNAWQSKATTIS